MAVRVQVPPSAPNTLPIRQSYESPDDGAFFVWLLRMRVRLSSCRLFTPPEGYAVKSQMLTLLRPALYLSLFLTGACATTHNLTVHSNPEGATLTTVGTNGDLGLAPVLLIFDDSDLGVISGR